MKLLSRLFEFTRKEKDMFVNDRREAKRYGIPLKLNYSDPLTKIHGESIARDISRHGLRFPVSSLIPKGSALELVIEDPYSNVPIVSRAKVTWAEKFVAGDDAEDTFYEIGVRLQKKGLY
ncbi:MAG: PilZ domain-containing protein [Candidatus Omnitrophica bacterium]|nr:PilZ domain-containing protein [Candidatus Omnitrophota bacterium]MBU1933395.1 PilZ domain-containing protein [Candidatus Omnitrophota bacterium]